MGALNEGILLFSGKSEIMEMMNQKRKGTICIPPSSCF